MSFTVHVKPRGREFSAEAGETILDAALRNGFAFPYGCRSGACGACKGRVLEGGVRYDDEPLAVTEEEQAEGWALFCQAIPTGDVTIEVKEVATDKEIPVRRLPAKIAHIERASEDVVRLMLKLPEEERLQYLAGQYVDFLLEDGRKRAFSIANAPHNDELLEFHIKHVEGGRFTDHLFKDMPEKEVVRIEGPHGSFFLREDSDRPVIMLATGTGFGPIKAIIEHAVAEGSTRPIYLYWGARTASGLYMDSLARSWAFRYDNIHYIPVLSRPAPEDKWTGRTGHVQHAALADFDKLGDFEMYACGHPAMVYEAKDLFLSKGIDPEHCFSDAFEWAKD